jgi:hypothetical protein
LGSPGDSNDLSDNVKLVRRVLLGSRTPARGSAAASPTGCPTRQFRIVVIPGDGIRKGVVLEAAGARHGLRIRWGDFPRVAVPLPWEERRGQQTWKSHHRCGRELEGAIVLSRSAGFCGGDPIRILRAPGKLQSKRSSTLKTHPSVQESVRMRTDRSIVEVLRCSSTHSPDLDSAVRSALRE